MTKFTTSVLVVLGLVACLALGFVGRAWLYPSTGPRDTAPHRDVFSYDPEEIPGSKPWTSAKFKNDPYDFQFAILGDRCGGASPLGTYERAIEQLNWLQPEFVMSVGDYVEGYTTHQKEMDEQWDEFEGIIAKLDMPFFYVRGNHDINMPLTRKAWAERRGPQYYHFLYKDVLFIVLDTEDAERPMPPNMERDIATYNRLKKEDPKKATAFIIEWMKTPEAQEAFGHATKVEFPEKQRAWFKEVLAENKDVRWTFVFLHEPVWDNPSDSFKEIDKAIQGRDYTFFAGHTHYYDYDRINDHEYITVASAGAAFTHDGPGNVDHLTWVTMTEDGPQFANIALKGIFDRKGLDPKMFGAYDRAPVLGPGSKEPPAEPGKSLGITSVPNLRDLGGYKTAAGAIVAAGLVYRSNQLSGVSPEDMEKIAQLNLKSAYDLRTYEERKKRPGELPPEVNYVWLDVLADADEAGPAKLEKLMEDPKKANAALGGGKAEAEFQKAYREFVSLPSARLEFRKLFLSLGDKDQLPALFHCTTGKDRTGWAAAALLTLLGVPRDKVMEDYLRSNDYIIPKYQKVIDSFVAAGGDKAIPPAVLGVKKEYLEASFDEMEKKYGTIEKYFSEGLGIDAARQKALRDLYLERK
jgi:protein tyrosine/serine phosphatase/predicted phosphodiesterase